jgi:hypothetical protein
MRMTPLLAAGFVAVLALPALPQTASAQTADGKRVSVRGTVDKLDGRTLMVTTRDKQHLTLTLAADFQVTTVVKRNLADIKSGDYVASTSVVGTDRKLHAIELHIFPEAMRGAGEGQRPWDLVPDSLMTNATVEGVTSAPQGRVLKVVYKGTESDVMVDDGTPVVGMVPGDMSLLKPGAAIVSFASQAADGTLSTGRAVVEKDGVKPPM